MRKKLLAGVLTAAMMVAFIPSFASASSVVDKGYDENAGVNWSYSKDKVMTISPAKDGNGEMADLIDSEDGYELEPDWGNYMEKATKLVISDGITRIGANSFNDATKLKTVVIGKDVRWIGNYAFQDCTRLTNVTYKGTALTIIGNNAFAECENMKSVPIPEGVISIGENAYAGCYALDNVVFPSTLVAIGDHAFYSCYSLKTVTMPVGLISSTQEQNIFAVTPYLVAKNGGVSGVVTTIVKDKNGNPVSEGGAFVFNTFTWSLDEDLLLTIDGSGTLTSDVVSDGSDEDMDDDVMVDGDDEEQIDGLQQYMGIATKVFLTKGITKLEDKTLLADCIMAKKIFMSSSAAKSVKNKLSIFNYKTGNDKTFKPTVFVSNIAKAAVTIKPAKPAYTGAEVTPAVTVKLNGETLKEGTDYTLTYSDNTAVSTKAVKGKVTITGMGRYENTVTKTFSIVKAAQTVTVDPVGTIALNSTAQINASSTAIEPVTFKYASSNKKIAKVDANGVITPVKAGTVKISVTAAGTGNYKASKTVTIKVKVVNAL